MNSAIDLSASFKAYDVRGVVGETITPDTVRAVGAAFVDVLNLAGQTVLVMEAMKMQHTVTAPTDGVVSQINVKAGSQVGAGDVLAVVDGVEGEEA